MKKIAVVAFVVVLIFVICFVVSECGEKEVKSDGEDKTVDKESVDNKEATAVKNYESK